MQISSPALSVTCTFQLNNMPKYLDRCLYLLRNRVDNFCRNEYSCRVACDASSLAANTDDDGASRFVPPDTPCGLIATCLDISSFTCQMRMTVLD